MVVTAPKEDGSANLHGSDC